MMELLNNRLLWTPLLASISAQLFKVLLIFLTEKRWAFERTLETGGMPSAHSAVVSSLATGIGLQYGVGSPLFAITAIFGSIVIYDATGIRRAAGLHAEMLNELVENLAHLFDEGQQPKVLKTLLGHTYPQVAVGVIIGVSIGLLVFL